MSDNKGKNGELMVLGILNDASIALGGIEPLRPTSTHTADQGVDIVLVGSKSDIETVIGIGEGTFKDDSEARAVIVLDNTRVKARVDVKSYGKGITKAAVDKFVSEVFLLEGYDYHIMAGSKNLLPKAEAAFNEAKEQLAERNKHLHYINDHGLYHVAQTFPPTRPTNPQEHKVETDQQQQDGEENKK
ncbi:hypothetical protein RZ87_06775 [Enterobacter roggenkampii]|uniref:hypothetical protein n=1 Tax=Enterobacter sp. NFIX58 TaxID=1566251 RepID=UPI0005F9609E|nr:hypothetical protein [Enterobacter sp. NFIX58]KJX00207.1 hypothetical protein RZ87_06775 [Enterobacter roggenkampii]SEP19038.1 hypothetical protein SAMN03159286_3461 [Enterobacter sp. NFIX58]